MFLCSAGKESDWSASAYFEPVCGAVPTALAVTARTAASATLEWTSTETAWKIQLSTDGGTTWESEVNAATNPFTLMGLTAGTAYQARVQNACGGVDDWSTPVAFTTVCGARDEAELPLNEDFASVSDYTLPDCWERVSDTEYPAVESAKLFFRADNEQIVVLPKYDIELNKLTVSFDLTTNNASLQFGYLTALDG